MKALVISEYAHPSQIPLTRDAPVPVPTPDSDELLINVHSAGLNFFDASYTYSPSFCFHDASSHMKILQAQGKYQTQPPRPFVLGTEFAGTVAVAPLRSPYKPGDRVFGYTQGAYGEQVMAKPVHVLPLPDALSFDQGAGASCRWTASHIHPNICPVGLFATYPTSYEALVGRGKLKAGTRQRHPTIIPYSLLSYVLRRVAARVSSSRRRRDDRDPNWQRCEPKHPLQSPAHVIAFKLGDSAQHSERGSSLGHLLPSWMSRV